MYIVIAIIIFGIIVLIHEFGHFIVAKKCGVTVLEFSIGMGPRIMSIHGKETEYSLKLLPFGGSCMMLGEDDSEDKKEGSFNHASPFKRFAIIAAGPFFNFILAFILALMVVGTDGIDTAEIASIVPGYPAEAAGLEAGDTITKIDNQKITIYRDVSLFFYMNQGKPVDVTVKRDTANGEQLLSYHIEPTYDEEYQSYMIGIVSDRSRKKVDSIGSLLRYSVYEVEYNITSCIKSLMYMLAGKASPKDISSPIRIVTIIGDTVQESESYGINIMLLSIANLIILLSANLGVMNLLPLPALDGGRLVFIIAEIIMGRPINRKFEGLVHLIGFALLMVLMVLLMFNDIYNLFLSK